MEEIQTPRISRSQLSVPLPAAAFLVLAGILVIAAILRFHNVNWDSSHYLHPDERHIVMVTMDRVALPFPNLSDAHLDDVKRSTLNPRSVDPGSGQPRSFAYGTVPLYLLKLAGHVLSQGWKGANSIEGLTIVGRYLSALFDLGTVLLLFLIGRRLYGVLAGLLASLLASFTVLHIQLSHFYASDTLLTFFIVATLYLGLRVAERPSSGRVVAMGVAAGLALSCKVSAAPVLLACVVACLLGARHMRNDKPRESRFVSPLGGSILAGAVALVIFALFQPYALVDPQSFLKDIQYESNMVRGVEIPPYTIQYIRTEPVLYQLRNLLQWTAGPTLGAAILVGLLALAVRLLLRRRPEEWVLVAWLAAYLATTLTFQVKFVRYLLPAMPVLVLLAAAWLAPVGRAALRWRPRKAWLPAALLLVVVAGTAAQAVAFTSIYDAEHTRVRASRWIYENVPRGSALATEHWDDSLPLHLADVPLRPGDYVNVSMPMYDGENEAKRQDLYHRLDQVQYIILSSNRLYASIPRVPESYPLATAYYSLLMQEKLGFDLVATFTSYPALGPLHFVDDAADESFTVYDHPKVLIYKKSPDFSQERLEQLLGGIRLDQVPPVKQALSGRTSQSEGLLLSEDARAVQEEGGTWSELYDREGVTNQFPVLTWWLALELLGLLALPLAWRLFSRYPDRGYGLAKTLGLLIVAYGAWLLASLRLLPFGPLAIGLSMVGLGVAGFLLVRGNLPRFREYLVTNRRVFLVHELLFLAAFALFLFIRARNPDLWHLHYGGEKPMEFAFLNAIAKSSYFPPYDPWLAGGYINYYYFGYVLVATLIRLTGIVPAVAFNLAIASVFALTGAGLFSFGFNYLLAEKRLPAPSLPLRPLAGGVTAMTLVLLVGNLDGLVQTLEGLWKVGSLQIRSTLPMLEGVAKAGAGLLAVFFGGKAMPEFDFWRSTRIIGPENPTPITEFPFFTFLYGDLHPHMIAMPIATLALGLVLALVLRGRGDSPLPEGEGQGEGVGWSAPNGPSPRPSPTAVGEGGTEYSSLSDRLLTVFVGGLVVGTLQATNSWDYPTYLLLLSVGYLLAEYARGDERPAALGTQQSTLNICRGRLTARGVLVALLSAAATYAVGVLLFLPFTHAYELFYNGVDPAPAKTSLQHYLVIFGFFLFAIGSMLIFDLAGSRRHRLLAVHLWERVTRPSRASRRTHLVEMLVRPSLLAGSLPYLLPLLVGSALVAAIIKLHLVAALLVLGTLVVLSLFLKDAPPQKLLLLLFVGMGVALTLGVEFITIKGDIGRMNTVFKFYLQAWFLWGIASAIGIAGILERWSRPLPVRPPQWRTTWSTVLTLLLLAILIYPVMATPVKVGRRFQPTPPTLDGMAYMVGSVFQDQNRDIRLTSDYQAIRWIQDNVAGSPTLLEAQVPEYRWGSRVSIYTGLPTVLGWTWHERQQRWGYQGMIDQRLRDIKTMFESTDPALVARLLQRYGVKLVYVGDLERAYYPAPGLAKFESMVGTQLSIAYSADGVTVYEVRDGRPSVVPNRTSSAAPRSEG